MVSRFELKLMLLFSGVAQDGHQRPLSNISRDCVIRSSLRHASRNSSMVMTPSWLRSSFLNTRSVLRGWGDDWVRSNWIFPQDWCALTWSLVFLSSSGIRLPINSCTACTTSANSPLLMQPSPFKSYSLNVHFNLSYTEPRSNVESVTMWSRKLIAPLQFTSNALNT